MSENENSSTLSESDRILQDVSFTLKFNDSELKSKILSEKLNLENLNLEEPGSVKVRGSMPKYCRSCKKEKNEKKIWLVN